MIKRHKHWYECKPCIWRVDVIDVCMCACLHSSYPFSCTHTLWSNHWLAVLSPRPLLLWRLRKSSRCLGGWEIQQLLLVRSVLTLILVYPLHSQPLNFLLLFCFILLISFSLSNMSLPYSYYFAQYIDFLSSPFYPLLFPLICFLHIKQSCFPPSQCPEFYMQVIFFLSFILVRHRSF